MTANTARRLPLRAALGPAAAGLAFAVPAAAQAHVTADAEDTTAGAYTVVTFSVPHGCDGSATTKVAIDLPEGVDEVTPTRNPYYDVTTKHEKLAEPETDAHGNEVTERDSQVVYTAKTPLPDGERDSFELSLQIPEDAAGTTLTFPTTQTCEKGETAWTQVPKKGQSEKDLESPAPSVAVAAPGDASGDSSTATAVAQPQAALDGTTTALVVTSLVIGALGLLSGAAALITVRRRR
ncbi:YcnI family protein [Brachybacterium halotolerans subsp. kimchii]|uniref:YcnI family copper-binding membrane protein n=1 Tax=Brachybacterium halotolerans TaxID=2795215 RepID=UPI001E5F7746|nr:YcnI family protein [Brachybacterium halotolerans]UEJ81732.1 YcnI family protein [Brachybacterium halotolerans subsp. kimchii]